MAEQLRTTISAVFWSETTDDSGAIVDGVVAALPAEDQAATLVTVEYKPEGRPSAAAGSADSDEPT